MIHFKCDLIIFALVFISLWSSVCQKELTSILWCIDLKKKPLEIHGKWPYCFSFHIILKRDGLVSSREIGPTSVGPIVKNVPISTKLLNSYCLNRKLVMETERIWTGSGIMVTVYFIFWNETASIKLGLFHVNSYV